MYRLNFEKYVTVPVKFEKILPWIIKENKIDVLCGEAAFIKQMSLNIRSATDKNLYFVHSSYDTEINQLSHDDMLTYLGLRSAGLKASPFLKWQERFLLDKDYDLLLLAERFLFPYSTNIGSGRHILLPSMHLKGVGRNSLAIQDEYSHSWGGMTVKDALKSYIIDNYVQHKSRLGSLEIYGMFVYENLNKDNSPYVMLARDSHSYRLSQLNPSFLSLKEKSTVRQFLKTQFRDVSPENMLIQIIEHYIHAYANGIRYKSIQPDNLLVDGRWIDTESIDIKTDWTSHDFWISVRHGDINEQVERNSLVQEHFYQKRELVFCDSWIHQLYLMSYSTYLIYQSLWNDFSLDINNEFKNCIKKYYPAIDLQYWFDLLDQFESEQNPRFGIPLEKENNISSEILPQNFIIRGAFVNTQIGFHKLTLGESSEDPFEYTNRLVNKWEKLFWPTNLTFQDAFEVARSVDKLCGAI